MTPPNPESTPILLRFSGVHSKTATASLAILECIYQMNGHLAYLIVYQ